MLQFTIIKQFLKRVSIFAFFFLFIATSFHSCKKVENNNSLLNYESDFTKHFFETKTTPTAAIAAAIEKLKQENERSGFVNKLPKNCGLPLWEKLLFQKPAGNKSINNNTFSTGAGNNLTETKQGNSDIVIPLTINNSNLSSILIATSINDTFAIKCLTTNDYLYNVSHGDNVDTAAAMNNLTAFFYVENYSFGTTQFYHIPANLFSRSTVLDGDGNKTITIKNVDSSTNNLMVCVCVTVVCPVCLGNDPNCPLGGTWQECSCTTVHDDEPGCPWCLPPPPPDGGGGSGGGGTVGGGGTSCSFASSWYNSIIPDCGYTDDEGIPLDANFTIQKNLINTWKNIIANESTQRKGNFGEVASDVVLQLKSYKPLHTRITNIDRPTQNGIDGVFYKVING